ncbi:MAG: RDD family protein [Proteobacteria bacterium]|nr:RDD family protein [Pseudomonadota bacterium]
MFCMACGTQLPDGTRFCTACGASVGASAAASAQQVWVGQSQTTSSSPQPIPAGNAVNIVYAGFMRRFAALFIDGLILAIPIIVIAVVAGGVLGVAMKDSDPATLQAVGQLTGFVIAIAIKALYFALMESSAQQATFGKRALGIKVTDEQGGRLSFGRALARYFASALSYATLYIGFLMAGFTDRKRALHDMIAGTLVVDRWAYTDHPERQQFNTSGCLIACVVVFCLAIPGIAILAAIAIPAYQDYVIRSQVSEGTALAEGSKTAVAEFYSNTGHFPPDNASAGVAEASSIIGNYVTSVQIDNGTIHISYGNKANIAIVGQVLGFAPTGDNGSTRWACGSEAGTTIPNKYRPTICRDSSPAP